MIRNYIEEKILTNVEQFEILDKEYQTVRKSENELKELIKRLKKTDDIDFLVFSPRGLWYTPENRLNEYDRRLKKLNFRKDELRTKMNQFLEEKLELQKLLKENKNREKMIPDDVGLKIEKANKEKEVSVLDTSNIIKGINSGINYRNKNVGLKHTEDNEEIKANSIDLEIKNWNKNGSIKIKSNGNTGKYFDALLSNSKSKQEKDTLPKLDIDERLNKNHNNSFLFEKTEIEKLGQSLNRKKAKGNSNLESGRKKEKPSSKQSIIKNNHNDLIQTTMQNQIQDALESATIKNISKKDMVDIISKVEECEELLNTDVNQCFLELKKLKAVLENIN